MPSFQQKQESMMQTQILKAGNKVGALGQPRGMGWGGRWEAGSGWGAHVHP